MGPFSEILRVVIYSEKESFLFDGNQMGSFFRAPWGLQTVRKYFGLVFTKLIILVLKHNFSCYS